MVRNKISRGKSAFVGAALGGCIGGQTLPESRSVEVEVAQEERVDIEEFYRNVVRLGERVQDESELNTCGSGKVYPTSEGNVGIYVKAKGMSPLGNSEPDRQTSRGITRIRDLRCQDAMGIGRLYAEMAAYIEADDVSYIIDAQTGVDGTLREVTLSEFGLESLPGELSRKKVTPKLARMVDEATRANPTSDIVIRLK